MINNSTSMPKESLLKRLVDSAVKYAKSTPEERKRIDEREKTFTLMMKLQDLAFTKGITGKMKHTIMKKYDAMKESLRK